MSCQSSLSAIDYLPCTWTIIAAERVSRCDFERPKPDTGAVAPPARRLSRGRLAAAICHCPFTNRMIMTEAASSHALNVSPPA